VAFCSRSRITPWSTATGWLWGTCAETRAWGEIFGQQPVRLLKYHPGNSRFVVFVHGLPRFEQRKQLLPPVALDNVPGDVLAGTRHRQDFGFCDSVAYEGCRYFYAGTVAGVLCRIDIESGTVEKVANVISPGRFPALAIKDGVLYGSGSMHGRMQLLRWRTDREDIEGIRTWWAKPPANVPRGCMRSPWIMKAASIWAKRTITSGPAISGRWKYRNDAKGIDGIETQTGDCRGRRSFPAHS
jgi:hypothetical protein